MTRDQLRRHLEQMSLELAAIGGGYDLPKSELRRRALVLFTLTRQLLERLPE